MRVNNFEHPGAVLASSHKINIENESTVKKLEKQIIVTGSGIEISIPMIVYNRADIEIKQNSYGEDEIIIHNVDSMSLKNLRFL